MRPVTIGVINLDQAELTIAMLERLAELPSDLWSVQLILIDNGSASEDTMKLRRWIGDHASSFGDIVFLETGKNLGASAGRNLILARSDGDRILILDNDIVLADDDWWLKKLWTDLDDETVAIAGPMLVFAEHPEVVQAAGIGLTRLGRVGYLHRGDLADGVPPESVRVVASPAACWLMSAEAQQSVGHFPEIYHPMQYWDVDYCMQLRAAGFGVLCDRSVRVRHIANVTTRSLGDRTFARTAVRHGMIFRERWGDELAELDVMNDSDIYWGPIPRP